MVILIAVVIIMLLIIMRVVALITLVLKYNMLEVIAMIEINDQIVHLDLLKILTKATLLP